MKTALIKTDFWKDDRVFELTPDVRMFYLCLLTNPERNTTRVFKCGDRMMSAYTGYSSDTIRLCRDKLVELNLIQYVDNFYILSEDNNVEPKKGKLTNSIQEDYLKNLPTKVLKALSREIKSSSEALEYVNVDNNVNKYKDNYKYNDDFLKANAEWSKLLGRDLSDNKTSRDAFRKLRKEKTQEDILFAIKGAVYYKGVKYKPQVLSFKSLYEKWDNLVGHMSSDQKNHNEVRKVY